MTASTEYAYLRFRVGQEWYGLPVNHVVEVLHMVALNTPPDESILGILKLRDMLVPVIDVRALFGVQPRPMKLDTPIVTVRLREQIVGWIVDEADDVVTIPVAAHLSYSAPYIHQAAKVDEQLLFIINTNDLIRQTYQQT